MGRFSIVLTFAFAFTTQKMKFFVSISSVNGANPQFPVDLVLFTEEILNGKLHFLCSVFDLNWKVDHENLAYDQL